MVRCPVCDREMKEVSARANPGSLIVLDQCPKCGGIWCDKWELFPIHPEEAPQLDPLDESLLRGPAKLTQTLRCPRCRDRLMAFKEPFLPPEIQLQRCRRCEGIWLNRGQFGLYKRFQRKTREEKLGKDMAVQRVAEGYQDPKFWVTTGTRGIFAYPRGAVEADDVTRDTVGGAFKLILQTLLRMVLGF